MHALAAAGNGCLCLAKAHSSAPKAVLTVSSRPQRQIRQLTSQPRLCSNSALGRAVRQPTRRAGGLICRADGKSSEEDMRNLPEGTRVKVLARRCHITSSIFPMSLTVGTAAFGTQTMQSVPEVA